MKSARVYLDLDEDGPAKLKDVLQDSFSGKLPSPSYIINTSPGPLPVDLERRARFLLSP